jgi:hypothetical protein
MTALQTNDAWMIDESDFYELGSHRDAMEFLLRYAVLAPSGHNTQPWKFAIVPEGVEVFADYSRRLPLMDPDDRELVMSVGSAIFNLRVAAAHFGYETTVLHHPQTDENAPLALVSMRETCDTDLELRSLFPAIQLRRTNRHPFDARTIDPAALAMLCDLADQYPDEIQLLLPRDKERIAELVGRADRVQMQDRALRAELAEWVRSSRHVASDGIAADALGIPDMFSSASAAVLRRLDVGGLQARRDEALIGSASLLAVVSGEDDRRSLVDAGQLLERLLLTVTLAGLHYSFMNQPVEVKSLRNVLASMIRSPHPPQLLMRIGYALAVTDALPRREVREVVFQR